MESPIHRNQMTPDPWSRLREVTSARIALGRSGGSLPTYAWLDFKSAHAAAREAVQFPFDDEQLATEVRELTARVVIVSSAAADRRTYLERPDLGRRLDDRSCHNLRRLRADSETELAILISDGLSAIAVHRQVCPLLKSLLPKLRTDNWRLAPLVIARFGRVALEDEVGELLGAQMALMLIGERPGLGSPDSLGAYFVYKPRVGNTDADRNCVSNIRSEGLPHDAAAETIFYLLSEARRRQLSGVSLKDQRAINDRASRGQLPR